MFYKDKDVIIKSDDQMSPLIYQILQNNADAVEIVHTREWEKYAPIKNSILMNIDKQKSNIRIEPGDLLDVMLVCSFVLPTV
jgi:hypothetical protein